jgi:hypothetical protein
MNLVELLVFYGFLFLIAFAGQWIFSGTLDFGIPLLIAWGICVLIGLAPVYMRAYRWICKKVGWNER